MPKNPIAIYHELGRESSLNGVEKGILWILIQSEINALGGATSETQKVLKKNFKKHSPILLAFGEFRRRLSAKS